MLIDKLLRESGCSRRIFSDEDRENLRPHAGKVFRLRLGTVPVAFRIEEDGTVTPVHPAISADATVEMPLERLAGKKEVPTYAEGDSELLSALGKVAGDDKMTFFGLFERVFGKDAGSAVAVCGRNVNEWRKDASERLSNTFANWLFHEASVIPTPDEARKLEGKVRDFARKVDALDAKLDDLHEMEGGTTH